MPPLNPSPHGPVAPPDHGAGPLADEFPADASVWPTDLSRRRFLEMVGASLALAGLGACNRPPAKTIVPYVTPPDRGLADGAVYYATAMPWEGYARGLLALSHAGRPTKLEGNPAHPDSLGAADFLMQAAVLSLYDPDRSRAPRRANEPTSWTEFENTWLDLHRQLSPVHGRGLALLTEPTTSPTLLRTVHGLLDRFPEARWFQHTPLPRYDHDGGQLQYDFDHAEIVLAIDADFLLQHPSALRHARAFGKRRRIEGGRVDANRLYVIETGMSVTGSMADHRIPASPARTRALLNALKVVLDGGEPSTTLTSEERRVLHGLAGDLREKAPRVLCVVGDEADASLHAWAAALNTRLGANGVTCHRLPAVRSDGDARCAGDLAALVEAARRGDVETLVVAGVNPAYTTPPDLEFPAALKRVRHRIHLGSQVDETAVLCQWHVPESHFLESWGDLRAFDGTAAIIQPLIAPMYASRWAIEFIHFLANPPGGSDYDLVRETWQKTATPAAQFEQHWQQWLNRGIIDDTAAPRSSPTATPAMPALAEDEAGSGLTLLIRPDPTLRDGRWSNNAWLQELPKPHSQLVWDNPVHVSPAFAARHAIENGDVVALRTRTASIAAPAWIAPGLAPDCVIAHLGYGRTHAGSIGNGKGFDAFALRHSRAPWATELLEVRRTGERVPLVSTHAHFRMEGRDIVRTATASNPAGTAGLRPEPPPSLYPEWRYDAYRWAMLIDLGACIGCKACVIACQAENNIPVVGKEQVARGREMHWIRVDQYYEGDPANPQVLHQPVPCMQCEKAPCELVCPVAATVHSSEGLNDMVYNRCIGTRYCSNNCPYKVRRFNFLDFRPARESPVYLQQNPEVSVRARGVMEKCTYCVQRINAARIAAERESRRIRDGEVRTACQQACPTEAIVFGDLNDPKSRVRLRKAEPTHYVLLEELNTRPRTTYLARITNRNDAVVQPAAEREARRG